MQTPPAAALLSLTLNAFRNFHNLHLSLSSKPILLTGPNGSGKTNILEAISALSIGSTLRGEPLANMTQWGQPQWQIKADGKARENFNLTATFQKKRRLFQINGLNAKPQAIAHFIPLIWITHTMENLFSGPIAHRRRFFDRATFSLFPSYAHHIISYQKALKQRLTLLTQQQHYDPLWLDALENTMASHGSAIAQTRLHMIQQLNASLNQNSHQHSTLNAYGFLESILQLKTQQTCTDLFKQKLKSYRTKDQLSKKTLVGPHRTDYQAYHHPLKRNAANCSTGQQKTILLDIVLAMAQAIGRKRNLLPIILMDEINAHLDQQTLQNLCQRIKHNNQQIWITTTNAQPFNSLKDTAQHLHLTPTPEDA